MKLVHSIAAAIFALLGVATLLGPARSWVYEAGPQASQVVYPSSRCRG